MHGDQTPSQISQLYMYRQELTAMTAAHKSTSCHGTAVASATASTDPEFFFTGVGHAALVVPGEIKQGDDRICQIR